uniref:Uncharacterized protein n=1 Tax=Panagrolaimus superbus TaxID=310955 RepID=A0A914YLY7_9BILA
MMRRYGRNTSDISPEPIRGLNVSDLNITNNNNFNDRIYIGPIQLSFSTSSSESHQGGEEEENISIISSDSSDNNDTTDDDEEENGIDLDAIMRHIDDCGRHIKRNLTDIVRVELQNLLDSLQPRKSLVPYPLSSDEEM